MNTRSMDLHDTHKLPDVDDIILIGSTESE